MAPRGVAAKSGGDLPTVHHSWPETVFFFLPKTARNSVIRCHTKIQPFYFVISDQNMGLLVVQMAA